MTKYFIYFTENETAMAIGHVIIRKLYSYGAFMSTF